MERISSFSNFFANNTSKSLWRAFDGMIGRDSRAILANELVLRKLTDQASASEAGAANGRMHLSRTQTAQSVVGTGQDIAQRLGQLAVQATDSSLSANDRAILQTEADGLIGELNDMMSNTKYNGQDLFAGDNMEVLVDTKISYTDVDGTTVTNELVGFDLSSTANAEAALDMAKNATQALSNAQVQLGATEGQIGRSITSAENKAVNLDAAVGDLLTSDITSFAKNLAQDKVMFNANAKVFKTQSEMSKQLLKFLQ